MARLDGKFIKGAVGATVFKKYRGKQVMQKAPQYSPSSQTKASKESATVFGRASNLAMSFRDVLSPIITGEVGGDMVNRLNSDVVNILNQSIDPVNGEFLFQANSFSRLNGFEFNSNSLVRDTFFAQPSLLVTGTTLNISIPEIQMPSEFKFPKGINWCMLGLGLGMFDLEYGHTFFSPVASKEIEYQYDSAPIPAQEFNFEIEPGCLCIMVISLQFLKNTFAGRMFYNTVDFNPVAVLNAFIAEGAVNEDGVKNWDKMRFKRLSSSLSVEDQTS